MYERRGGRPGLLVPNSLQSLCERNVTLEEEVGIIHRGHELCDSRDGRPGLPVPNNPYGLCGRNATLNSYADLTKLRSCVKVDVDGLRSRP